MKTADGELGHWTMVFLKSGKISDFQSKKHLVAKLAVSPSNVVSVIGPRFNQK